MIRSTTNVRPDRFRNLAPEKETDHFSEEPKEQVSRGWAHRITHMRRTEAGPSRTAAVSSSTNDHLEEVLKGQAQQAEFLQHMWVQQSQMQQALQQQVCALTGAIQQLAETQQGATAWTSKETRRKTSRG